MIFKRILTIALCLTLIAGARAEDGLTASDVLAMEQRLTELGYLTGADDAFDQTTTDALAAFQTANGLRSTGAADPNTLALLQSDSAVSKAEYLKIYAQSYAGSEPLAYGSKGSEVRQLQKQLVTLGYLNDRCDGVFGAKTQAAVECFQMANGISVTGIADEVVIRLLLEGNPFSWYDFLKEMSAQSGDTGLNVYNIQKKLTELDYYEGDCTGTFGEMTLDAVSRFQLNNGLPSTGVADTATIDRMYADDVIASKRDDVLKAGDYGAAVREAQSRLTELGYYNRAATGDFSAETETAVRLFQMANDLTVSGSLDEITLEKLQDEAAPACTDDAVSARFEEILANANENVFGAMSEIAGGMLGEAFSAQDDAFYPGFSFVQYVCVAAGLPVTDPNMLLPFIAEQVEPQTAIPAGSVVMFLTQDGEEEDCLLTVSIGNDRVLYATAEGGWVVMSDIESQAADQVYRWLTEEEYDAG